MKKIISLQIVFLFWFLIPMSVHAILIDRGGGLIYDSGLNITWLQDANYADTTGYDDILYGIDTDGTMFWADGVAWAADLVYQGFEDWRLPFNPEVCQTFGCDVSEMGHLFHVEGISATSPGPFSNVRPGGYWANNQRLSDNEPYWFGFADGGQGTNPQPHRFYAWAVRDGDSAQVPEPSSLLLLGAGLVGLAFTRKRISS